MKHRSDDQRTADSWDVTQCECGDLTLRLGPIRLDFSPEEFARLHRLIDGAVQQFQGLIEPRTAHGKPFMH